MRSHHWDMRWVINIKGRTQVSAKEKGSRPKVKILIKGNNFSREGKDVKMTHRPLSQGNMAIIRLSLPVRVSTGRHVPYGEVSAPSI